MPSIQDLKADRAAALEKAEAINAAAKAMDRDLSDDELTKVDALMSSVESFDAQIEKIEKRSSIAQRLSDAKAPETAPTSATRGRVEVGKDEADKIRESATGGFSNRAAFLHGVLQAGMGRAPDKRLRALQATAGSDEHGEYDDARGGFLVPQQFRAELLRVPTEVDPTIGRTTRIPMESSSIAIPARVDKNHTSSVTGGVTFQRRAETQAATASRSQFEQIRLTLNNLTALSYVTEELLEDSPISVAAMLDINFGEEYASKLLDEKINGTGVGEYQGVLNAACTVSVAKEGSQAADTINGTNLAKMRSRCWRYGQSIWIANHDCLPQLMAAHIAGTNGDVAAWQPSLVADRPDMLLGRPIFFSEYAKTLGDNGDIILGVWSEFIEGFKGDLVTAESMHVRFVENERAFKASARNDGKPWWSTALTPKNSSATLSPFVTLAERA